MPGPARLHHAARHWGPAPHESASGAGAVAANTPSSISGASDADFAEAMAEIDESKMEKGLWARCFAESEGDIKKTKASYIRHRAIKLSKPINSDVNSEFVPQIVKNKIVTEIILFWDSFNTVGRVCIFLIIGLIILLNWTHLR